MDKLQSLHHIIEELDDKGVELSDVFIDPRRVFSQINLTSDNETE